MENVECFLINFLEEKKKIAKEFERIKNPCKFALEIFTELRRTAKEL